MLFVPSRGTKDLQTFHEWCVFVIHKLAIYPQILQIIAFYFWNVPHTYTHIYDIYFSLSFSLGFRRSTQYTWVSSISVCCLSVCSRELRPTSDIDGIIADNLQRRLLHVPHFSHPSPIAPSRAPPRSPIIAPLTSCLECSSPPWFIYFAMVNEACIFTTVSKTLADVTRSLNAQQMRNLS